MSMRTNISAQNWVTPRPIRRDNQSVDAHLTLRKYRERLQDNTLPAEVVLLTSPCLPMSRAFGNTGIWET